MPEIIFDNCVLSNFAMSGSLDVVKTLYDKSAYVTDFVAAENMKGITHGYKGLDEIKEAIMEGWLLEVTLNGNAERALFDSISVSFGLGEASSMAVAKARKYLFACDDRAARKEAESLGIRLTGTIGIIVKAISTGMITGRKGDEILKSMIRHGFYAPVDSISELL